MRKSNEIMKIKELCNSILDSLSGINRDNHRIEHKLNLMENEINDCHIKEKINYSLLTGNFENNDACELFILKPYRGKPAIIKDGKRLDTERMTAFDVDWAIDRIIEVTIRNE